MKSYEAKNVMSGTWGELYIDDEQMAQLTEFKASVSFEKAAVNMVGLLDEQYKIVGRKSKGSLKMNHVSSYFVNKLHDDFQNGKQTVMQMVVKVADPDAKGSERYLLKNVVFDELTIIDFSAKKLCEDSYNFTFAGWEKLDTVKD